MADTLSIASLCSGVGMLDEGVRLGCAHLGIRTSVACYCEWESYAASVLLARMEDASLEPAPVWCGDIADFDGQEFAGKVDIVTAGFPCQPWSCAGQQRGTSDERWIWDDIGGFIRTARPIIVFLENVPGLVSGGGLNAVLADLADAGFDAEWCALSAADCGASHRRERVFILAYDPTVQRGEKQWGKPNRVLQGMGDASRERRRSRHHAVQPSGDRPSAGQADDVGEGRGRVANAVQPNAQLAAASRRDGEGAVAAGAGEPMGDAQGGRSPGGSVRLGTESQTAAVDCASHEMVNAPSIGADAGELGGREYIAFAPGPSDFDGWDRVVADCSFDFRAPATKPGIRVLVDGVALVVDASRTDQLRCAGNGVVALCAAAAFVELMRRAGIARAVREAVGSTGHVDAPIEN